MYLDEPVIDRAQLRMHFFSSQPTAPLREQSLCLKQVKAAARPLQRDAHTYLETFRGKPEVFQDL